MRNMYLLQNPWRRFKSFNSVRFVSSNMHYVDDIVDNEPPQKFEKFVNEVRLLGRVGKDPVVYDRNGKTCIEFLLGTMRPVIEDDVGQRSSDWHLVFSIRPSLVKELSLYVKKGQRLYVQGTLTHFYDIHTNKKQTGVMLFRYISFS